MKLTVKPFLFVLAVSISLFSCSKDDDSSENNSLENMSVTSDGILSGIFDTSITGEIDNIKFELASGDGIYGESSVSSTGIFKLKLKTPSPSKLDKWFKDGVPSGITASNELFMTTGDSWLEASKNNEILGSISKCNTIFRNANSDNSLYTTGAAFTFIVYCDRATTVKGTNTYIGASSSYTYTVIYDMSLNKGWNEITRIVTAYSKTATGESETRTYTTNIPSDLKWCYFPSSSSLVIQQ